MKPKRNTGHNEISNADFPKCCSPINTQQHYPTINIEGRTFPENCRSNPIFQTKGDKDQPESRRTISYLTSKSNNSERMQKMTRYFIPK